MGNLINNEIRRISALAVALLMAPSQATKLGRRHHHHHGHEFVSTLPDVRADTVADTDIAAHEAARAEAAKVKKNPQAALLASIKADLEAVNTDMSFGVSYSQTKKTKPAEISAARWLLLFWTTPTSSSLRSSLDQMRPLPSKTPTTSLPSSSTMSSSRMPWLVSVWLRIPSSSSPSTD